MAQPFALRISFVSFVFFCGNLLLIFDLHAVIGCAPVSSERIRGNGHKKTQRTQKREERMRWNCRAWRTVRFPHFFVSFVFFRGNPHTGLWLNVYRYRSLTEMSVARHLFFVPFVFLGGQLLFIFIPAAAPYRAW
jgi:hypothetical protein